ncbi:MAG: glycosyltransferase [Chloroflexota bacterium]
MILSLAILYVLLAVLLSVTTAGSLVLLLIHLLDHHAPKEPEIPAEWPCVTVQLPVYNEQYVVERLLDAVAALDYPVDKLVIQLLDDSTDATSRLAARKVAQLRADGLAVQHIRRADRTGFKAGALQEGMARSLTPYYAIFDADFVPPPDFLRVTLSHLLADDTHGMVQGRWGHLNAQDSPLTAAQALAIDGHFVIEQASRSKGGLLLNFNGTGGVWRADCIHDAGGWRDTTLTEDFDLSYRAQLRGWHMRTLPDLVVPGELPTHLLAFKQQQFRWAKGSTQCLLQTIRPLWRSQHTTLPQSIMGTLHLCQYMPYPLILMLALLAPPLLLAGVFAELPLAFMLFSGIVPPLVYAVSQQAIYSDGWRRMIAFPALVVFGTGIAINNTVALLSALVGSPGEFQRTPKSGTANHATYTASVDATTLLEVCGAVYIGWGAWLAVQHAPHAAPYLALSAFSYATTALWSLWESWQTYRANQRPPVSSTKLN